MKKTCICFLLLVRFIYVWSDNIYHDSKPALVVTITVNGLQTEHLIKLWPDLTDGGFKRIFNNGTFYPNTYSNYLSGGRASDCASIVTGTTPSSHGIISDKFFQPKTKEVISIVSDDRYLGISSQEGYSPYNLYASTFSDELKIVNKKSSKIFAIAINAPEAIVLGGHAANSAVWIDDKTGLIASSDFYEQGLPEWCASKNSNGTMEQMLNFLWTPMFQAFTYNFPAANSNERKPFTHKSSDFKNKIDKINAFKSTPFINKLIRILAVDAIRNEKLGKRNITDVLNLQFTVNTLITNTQELLTAEKEDIYLRLDRDLEQLLNTIEQTINIQNTLIVLTADQSENFSPETLKKHKINTGYFNSKGAISLLNNYLMLLNGQGNWVIGYENKTIYLNTTLAERKKKDINLLQTQTEQFMKEFQGVESVFITDRLNYISGNNSDLSIKVKNSIHPKRSGQIYLKLLPGWIETDNNQHPIGASSKTKICVPLVFYGFRTPAQRIDTEVYSTDIAPSICRLLQITFPNACSGNLLPHLFLLPKSK